MSGFGDKNVFAYNLKNYIDASGSNRHEICKSTGIKYTTMTNWLNKETYPRMDKVELLAKYFNITTDDLVEVNPKKQHNNRDITLIKKYLLLNEKDKEIIYSIILRMLNETL